MTTFLLRLTRAVVLDGCTLLGRIILGEPTTRVHAAGTSAPTTSWRRTEEISDGALLNTEMLVPIGQDDVVIEVALIERFLREAGYLPDVEVES